MVNSVRRQSLKTIVGAMAGAAATAQVPLTLAKDVTQLGNAGISISHVETVFGQTVMIQNLSDKLARLESLSPSKISTVSGEFDMDVLLSQGPIEIEGATTKAINVAADGRIHNWAIWNTLESSPAEVVENGSLRPVDIFVHHHSLAGPPLRHVQTGTFV
ncbi:MAG: hypothetical protein KTR18_09325 [Acidiferrobacterales bacterium]|nr:hypothetical protein [Acidiferrobacterales bacterium]